MPKKEKGSLLPVFLVLLVFAFFCFAIFTAIFGGRVFVDQSTALRALETQGYTNATITSRDSFAVSMRGCGRDDLAKFNVVATNPVGKRVHLFVCVGWPFKGATIRTN